jgi:hypothetical protein
MFSSVLFAFMWLPRSLLGRQRGTEVLSVRLLPLAAVLCLVGACGLVGFPSEATRFIDRFGKPTTWSIGLYVLTWLFPLVALAGFVQSFRGPWLGERRLIWIHGLLVSAAN